MGLFVIAEFAIKDEIRGAKKLTEVGAHPLGICDEVFTLGRPRHRLVLAHVFGRQVGEDVSLDIAETIAAENTHAMREKLQKTNGVSSVVVRL